VTEDDSPTLLDWIGMGLCVAFLLALLWIA
jgi:hypothetical protein